MTHSTPAIRSNSPPVRNLPTANITAAPRFTTRSRDVSTLGLIPVAAMTPTILSSSHLLPVPIAPVTVAMQRYTLSCAVSEDYFQEIVHYAQRGGKFVGRTIPKAILPLSDFWG